MVVQLGGKYLNLKTIHGSGRNADLNWKLEVRSLRLLELDYTE